MDWIDADERIAAEEAGTVSGEPKRLNGAFLRSLPDRGPVVMVNLVRFRERAADGNGSGWDAYLRYSEAAMPLIKGKGGTVLWAGRAEGVALGDAAAGRWDYVVLVRYPSRAAFLDMMSSPDYARANVHRENGVDAHLILAATQTYSKQSTAG
jgi:uncharacterized protein (DUF1330 family)